MHYLADCLSVAHRGACKRKQRNRKLQTEGVKTAQTLRQQNQATKVNKRGHPLDVPEHVLGQAGFTYHGP